MPDLISLMVMEMIRAGEVKEDDEDYQSALDILFQRLEMKNPEHIALKYYKSYHSGSGKTLKSIQITLISRLEKFNLSSLASITQTDELELATLGDRKSAIYAVIPDNDSSFNFLIGRIADETPFVVEWFVRNGIRVWSTQEGEQRFDNHTDKLTNYIRFWQADGESEKTSIRTRTALGQLVQAGGFRGGVAPYGYDLVKTGRFNKRKHEVHDLAINEAEAAVVRIMFEKYVQEGYGPQRISTYLNELGYRARSGKPWHPATITHILVNPTYMGVLRSGDSRSEVLPHLQIIDPELFEASCRLRAQRKDPTKDPRSPRGTKGKSLLSGNVYCGHCGSRLVVTTNGKAYPCKEDPGRVVKRIRYICYGKTRKQCECDGATGYTAHILDGIIDKVVRHIFDVMKSMPKADLVGARYGTKMAERKTLLTKAKKDYTKAAGELETLKSEVVKAIRGESSFSTDILSSLIQEAEAKCSELQKQLEEAQEVYDNGQAVMEKLGAQYDEIITWSEMYETASIEAKRMIVGYLIKRVDVYKSYKLHIEFNIDFEQFREGIDFSEQAA